MRIYTSSGRLFFEAHDFFTGNIVSTLIDDIVDISYEYIDDTCLSFALCLFFCDTDYCFINGSLTDVMQCFRVAGVFNDYKYLFCI